MSSKFWKIQHFFLSTLSFLFTIFIFPCIANKYVCYLNEHIRITILCSRNLIICNEDKGHSCFFPASSLVETNTENVPLNAFLATSEATSWYGLPPANRVSISLQPNICPCMYFKIARSIAYSKYGKTLRRLHCNLTKLK